MLRPWIDRWNRYWFEPISPFPIAATRVVFGAYLIIYFSAGVTDVELTLSSQGVPVPFLVSPEAAPGPSVAALLYAVAMIATVAFTLGYRTVVATRTLFVLFVYHFIMSGGVYSYDRLNIVLLAIFCGAESGAVWSLDSWRDGAKPAVSAWATRLIKLEIATMYFGSGLYKLLNPLWHDSTLIEMTFAGEWATPVAFWVVGKNLPTWLWDGATWAVIAFEIAIGFALYARRIRMIAIVFGATFHLANWILLGVPQFMNCVAMYPLFISSSGVESLGGKMIELSKRLSCALHLNQVRS